MLTADVGLLAFAIFAWVVILTIQNLMTHPFLRRLEVENPKKRMEVSTGAEQFWDHTKPFRIGAVFLIPGKYESWNLSSECKKSARRLRFISVLAVVATITVIATLIKVLM